MLAASTAEEDVVVGADKREQSLGNVASAVTVISGDRLRRFGYRTVGEALSAVAGVYLVDDRLSYSIGIRGLQIPGDFNTRILVLVDGASVNESWGSFAGIGFDTFVSIDDISRIELIRGPVSSVYGANAFFGIVNIVTKNASESGRAWGHVSVSSINGVVTSAGFAQGGVDRQVRAAIQIMDRFGDTSSVPEIPENTSLRDDVATQFAGSVVGSYKGTFAQVRAYRFRRDSPFAPYLGDATAPTPYESFDKQVLVEGGHHYELSKRLSITARAYVNLYEFTDRIIQDPALAGTSVPFDDVGDARTYGAEVRGRYELLVPQHIGVTAGVEANDNQTESHSFAEDGSTDVRVPKTFDIEGVYAELDGQPTEWLGFTAGARFDRDSAVETKLSPRAALFVAAPDRYGVKLLYAEGFRNPSAYEAFFHDDTSFAQPVNLGAETIRSFETVLWAKPLPGLSARLSGYRWDARGIITPEVIDVMGTEIQQFQNAGRLVSNGVEVEASYRDVNGWYAFGGFDYSQVGADDAQGDLGYGNVLDAPAVTAGGGVSTPKIAGRVHVSTELVYIGERAAREDTSPPWLGWNWAIYAPAVFGFDVTAGVRNLIGHRDFVVTPGDYDRGNVVLARVPGEGREVYVKVGYSY